MGALRFRRRDDESPADELRRVERALQREQATLAELDSRVNGLASREAEIAADAIAAALGDCDAAEHERDRVAFERTKTDVVGERDRKRGVVTALQERRRELASQIEEDARQEVRDEIAALTARLAQQQAAVTVTAGAIAAAEVRLEDLSLPEPTRDEIEWHVRRHAEGLPTAPPTNNKLARAVEKAIAARHRERDPDAEREARRAAALSVRRPDGSPAYMSWPGPATGPFPVELSPEDRP